MSSARYERLPTSSPDRSRSPVGRPTSTSLDLGEEEANIGRRQSPTNRVVFAHDPRFEIPTPPAWQRVALIAFIVFLFWLGFRLRGSPVEEGVPAVVE